MNDNISIIDRTNKFYIEMSRKVLSTKEQSILWGALVKRKTFQELASDNDLSRQQISKIYNDASMKIKSITEILGDIDTYKEKLHLLRAQYIQEYKLYKKPKSTKALEVLNKKFSDSAFPFSNRLRKMLEFLELSSIGDLATIPLTELKNFRGFKNACKEELIVFIEFEEIEDQFDDYYEWKKEK